MPLALDVAACIREFALAWPHGQSSEPDEWGLTKPIKPTDIILVTLDVINNNLSISDFSMPKFLNAPSSDDNPDDSIYGRNVNDIFGTKNSTGTGMTWFSNENVRRKPDELAGLDKALVVDGNRFSRLQKGDTAYFTADHRKGLAMIEGGYLTVAELLTVPVRLIAQTPSVNLTFKRYRQYAA